MKIQVSKELLLTYFAGRATALQKQAIDEWAKDEDSRELFYMHLAAWERQNPQFIADDRNALERHQQRMQNGVTREYITPTVVEEEPAARLLHPGWLRWMIAASIATILLLSGLFFNDYALYRTYHTNFGQTRLIKLPDGSRVTLNANSTLRVPRFGFGTKSRKVSLVGEADFSIRHLPDHQRFIVATDKDFEIVVLGTEFMVSTRERTKKVVLNTGRVQLVYKEGKASKQLTMKPGNLVTFDTKGRVRLKHTSHPETFTSWKEHRFVFDRTTLEEIGNLFEENYGLELQITDKALAHWTISGAFRAYTAEELMETLATASNLTYTVQGKTIIVSQSH
ncbi:FecR family protein [Spirosoma fluviale]|uniref:FecR family protein n=1 Tax=Spirosoma fluviale TaxID=1597977 RepID=A0A286G9Q5_9BACT|nr:FecR domain-containing protein [Spirosoma fluviale]SOD92238.1 FecR family protein [Spirosoma fluviale]